MTTVHVYFIKNLFINLFKYVFIMKKLFTLFAVAALAFAAQAATLTVAEGAAHDAHYPFYALYYDTPGTLSQVIYPADMLTDLVGKQITEIKFFTNGTIYLNGGQLEYSLKVVDQIEFATSNPVELGEEDVCGHGAPVYGESVLVITLDEPFQYDGGNLLLQTVVAEAGDYQTLYFYGITTGLYGAMYQYQGWSGTWYAYTTAFLPMAEFTYEEGDVPPVGPTDQTAAPSSSKENYVYEDANLQYNAYTVTLIETEPSDIYYRVGILVDGDYVYGDWMLYTGEMNFTEEGTYMIEAYAIAPGKLESEHIWDGFTVSKVVDVEELFAGKTVANVRYYNLAGQEMQQANGVTIMVTTFTDGTTSAVKVVK